MGNAAMVCVSGGEGGDGGGAGRVEKVRVLLPDGNIVYLDGPMDAADLMIEHINHMVMHCSKKVSGAKGQRTATTILQPHEKLQPGQAYVVHPIPPPSNTKAKLRPLPLSVPNLNGSEEKNDQNSVKDEEQAKSYHQSKPRFLQRYHSRVADSSEAESNEAESPSLRSEAIVTLQRLFDEEPRTLQKDLKDSAKDESKDVDDVLLNLNIYMGWRPALESIPESPLGYDHPRADMVHLPPLLCV